MRVYALIPAYNERDKIGLVVRRIPRELVEEIVVIDDGSSDGTDQEAREAGATVLRHDRNQGVGAAIRTGLHHGREKGYQVATVMGGDDQDNPEQMPRLLDRIQGGHDFVQGSRHMPGGERIHHPLFRRVTTRLYPILMRLVTGFPITDGTNGFRAFRLSLLEDQRIDIDQPWLNKYELEPYLLYQAIVLGYRVTEAPVTKRYPKERRRGYTKMVPIKDWWSILRPLIYLKLGLRK